MMKSFFKKLAFVMALAMVVSMAAPAAQASAAEVEPLGIALQSAKSKAEVLTADNVAVNETEDYKYYNAVKEYMSLHPTWKSLNEEVASVTQKGEVTGLKDGVATIEIRLDNGQVGTIEITVGEGEVVADTLVAEQTKHNTVKLTFSNTKLTKADLEKNLKVFFVVDGYEVEVQLIKSISDVKDGVATVEFYGSIADGAQYMFRYNGEEAYDDFVGALGAVSSVEIYQKSGKYVGDDIVLDVVYKNAKGVDITALVTSGYVTYSAAAAPNNEYYLSDNVVYFTTEYATTVTAEYHGFDENNTEFVIPSKAFPVVATNKPAYEIDFTAAPAWAISVNAPDWTKALNHDIAVGDDGDDAYRLFVQVKDNFDGKVVFPTGTTEGSFRYQSTKPSVLYVTDTTGYLMPNSQGPANVLVYFTPNNGKEVLVAVIPVTVSPARSVKNVTLDKTNATLSTVAGYNEATFKFTLKDGLGTAFEGATVDVKCTTTSKFTAPEVVVSGNSNADGELTVTVKASAANVADAGSQTYNYTATVNGITKTFSVTIKDPKGAGTVADPYANLSYGLSFDGAKAIKVENATPLVLTSSLAVLSNGAAIGNQELAGAKVEITDANIAAGKVETGKFYYEVKFNNTDITGKVTTSATGTVLNIPVTSTATEGSYQIVDYKTGVGSYTVTIYKAMAKANDTTNKPAYYSPVKTLTQEVTYNQPAITLAGEIKDYTTAAGPEAVVADCWKFKYGTNDINLASSDYVYTVDANVVPNAGICFVNYVTFYKKVGDNLYVKYTVDINDYVTFN